MSSIIDDHRRALSLFSNTVTAAQQSLVEAQLASHPMAQLLPTMSRRNRGGSWLAGRRAPAVAWRVAAQSLERMKLWPL